jgi:hypothetical protein
MAEDTTVVSEPSVDDVSLIDTPIAPKSDDTSGAAASQGTNEAAATDDKTEDSKSTDDASSTEATDQAAADATAAGQQDTTATQTPEAAQAERDRVARDAYIQRQRTRQETEKQLDQFYGPKTQQELIDEGVPPEDARYEALRQEMAYSQQRAQVAELNAGMQAEAVNAVHDFPIFDEKSKDFDPVFTQEVQAAYLNAARVQVDEHGIVTNAEIPLYDFYKRMADIYSRGASKGAQTGAADMAQMLGRTEDTTGGSTSTGSGDSLAELEERLGDTVIT